MDVSLIWLLALVIAAGGRAPSADRGDGTRLIRSPAEDLESKIREGLAKRVDPARILDTIRQRRESFRALGASLEKELREAGKDLPEGGARYETVLEMHRAMDLGLSRETVLEVLREAVRARTGIPADVDLVHSVIRFAGVSGGAGIPAEQSVRIVRRGLARGYLGRDFRLSCRRILDLRERYGERCPSRDVGRWMEEGIGRFPTSQGMLDYVQAQSEARIPAAPPQSR